MSGFKVDRRRTAPVRGIASCRVYIYMRAPNSIDGVPHTPHWNSYHAVLIADYLWYRDMMLLSTGTSSKTRPGCRVIRNSPTS